MLINAELLLQYQRCKRRTFLDAHGDRRQRDVRNELLLKIQQEKIAHKQSLLSQYKYEEPDYPSGNWLSGFEATKILMQQGVECIHKGVLLATSTSGETLYSNPDLLFKQPGESWLGDWLYVPATIELGKRPKQEYQIVAAFHAQMLATVQGVVPSTAGLMLRGRETVYTVYLEKWLPLMQDLLQEYVETLKSSSVPEVFISRQRCSLCRWYNHCYADARAQQHLSLIPGITPGRYTQLQAINLTTVESLANSSPEFLETLVGFNSEIAPKLVIQAQSTLLNRPLLLNTALKEAYLDSPIELYFDIEAQPDLNLDYLLGVLVVDRLTKTEKFYSFLAERPEDEALIWQQFLDLVEQYPTAPIYHFCGYEVDTVKRLAKLYVSDREQIYPLLDRFVDIYAQITQTVAIPVESYSLKAIARWRGFEWRDPQATGAQCIYWYDEWLETGDRSLLEIIQRYNEDDCRATYKIKDWLVNFVQS